MATSALLALGGVSAPAANASGGSTGSAGSGSAGSGSTGSAGSGGSGLGGTSSSAASSPPASTPGSTPTLTTPASSGSTPATVVPPSGPVLTLAGSQQASGDGITLTLAQFGELNHSLSISGEAPPADAGASIDIEGTSGSASSAWTQLASATVGPDGSFSAVWIPSSSASFTLQAVLIPSVTQSGPQTGPRTGGGALPNAESAASASAPTETQTLTLPVFKPSIASFYGPGFWGKRTACGEVLRRTTLGVANRTLPCGTMVGVYYEGREISVPVIDRGPYANHASWDLTLAVAKALHINQTSQVGTLAPAPATLTAAVRSGV